VCWKQFCILWILKMQVLWTALLLWRLMGEEVVWFLDYVLLVYWIVVYWYKKTEWQRGDTVWMCVFNSNVVISLQCTRTVCLIWSSCATVFILTKKNRGYCLILIYCKLTCHFLCYCSRSSLYCNMCIIREVTTAILQDTFIPCWYIWCCCIMRYVITRVCCIYNMYFVLY
jgi:hypothetical protein